MAASLERTSWREVQIDHPSCWELAVASGPDDPGRLTFSDRRYHRLDLKWRAIRYVPNVDLLLTRHHSRDQKDGRKVSPLTTAPPPWKGLVQETASACIVHAMRHFSGARLLVEASLVWPGRRDIPLENAVLASVATPDARQDARLWQAMGLSVTCPWQYDLRASSLKVGQIQWDFLAMAGQHKVDKQAAALRVERMAMPEHWLKGQALRDWLAGQLPPGARVISQMCIRQDQQVTPGPTRGTWRSPHPAEQILSASKAPLAGRIRGLQDVRLDLAWLCPPEGRAYHVQLTQRRTDERVEPLAGLQVRCCRPVPDVAASRNVG